ncbi:MAG TPA: kelch repeat-containing protein, partial [bacterium]|nr:kelch repeat-containing protein [bacterium]
GAFLLGTNGNLAIGCASIFDTHGGGFVSAGRMIIPRYGHAAISLPGGQLMVVGGYGPDGRPQATGEVYTPCWSAEECAAAGHPQTAPPGSCP